MPCPALRALRCLAKAENILPLSPIIFSPEGCQEWSVQALRFSRPVAPLPRDAEPGSPKLPAMGVKRSLKLLEHRSNIKDQRGGCRYFLRFVRFAQILQVHHGKADWLCSKLSDALQISE